MCILSKLIVLRLFHSNMSLLFSGGCHYNKQNVRECQNLSCHKQNETEDVNIAGRLRGHVKECNVCAIN